MQNAKRRLALVSAGAVLAALGLGGVVAAAQPQTPTPNTKASTVQDRENPATPDNDTNQGPDANAKEPGHQDANEAGEQESGVEKAESESQKAEDGPDQGPDANPNEPGHQDANQAGDQAGETK